MFDIKTRNVASKRKNKDKSPWLTSILVVVGGEGSDDDAVRLACELLNSDRGELYIVYVIEMERGLPLDAEVAPATAKAEAVLKHMEEVASPFKCNTQAELLQSRGVGLAVVQEAVDKQVDAIVLGIPYRERYGIFSMGDSIPYVLKNAPCKVIVWRDLIPRPAATNGLNPFRVRQ